MGSTAVVVGDVGRYGAAKMILRPQAQAKRGFRQPRLADTLPYDRILAPLGVSEDTTTEEYWSRKLKRELESLSSRPEDQDIVIVDDRPENLRLLVGILQERGYRVMRSWGVVLAIVLAAAALIVSVSKRSNTAPSAPQPRLVIVPSDAAINALLEADRKFHMSGLGEEAMLQWDIVQEHRQALVDFGVLQQVFFPLNPIDRSSEGFAKLSAIVRVEARGGPFARFEWLPGNDRSPAGVTVWCKPEDLGRWETALSAFFPGR